MPTPSYCNCNPPQFSRLQSAAATHTTTSKTFHWPILSTFHPWPESALGRRFGKLNTIDKPINNASVHEAIVSLSPLKKGRTFNYFDGAIADETSKLRIVGFTKDQQEKLDGFFKAKLTINLYCQVKESHDGTKLEVMLKPSTQIQKSSKDIDNSKIYNNQTEPPVFINVSEIFNTPSFQRICVKVKVINLKPPIHITGERLKQDITIADATGVIRLYVWEQQVNTLKLNQSYSLQQYMGREFSSQKYLTTPRDGSQIVAIEDIGEVAQKPATDDVQEPTIFVMLKLLQSPSLIRTNHVYPAKPEWNLTHNNWGDALNVVFFKDLMSALNSYLFNF